MILGSKHRQRFLCEVRLNSFPYIGAGNSTNKKDAEKNASRDFISYLVRSGRILESEVPVEGTDNQVVVTPTSNDNNQQPALGQSSSSGSLSSFSPNQLGQAYRPVPVLQHDGNYSQHDNYGYMDRAQEQARMEEAESLDINAGLKKN